MVVKNQWFRAVLLGGFYDGGYVDLRVISPMIQIGDKLYSRIDDPDTGEYLGGYIDSGLIATRLIPCPGSIPPWEAPADGERLAYEGWAAWVHENGNFSQRMQLMAYRMEALTKVSSTRLSVAAKTAAENMAKFLRAVDRGPK